MADGRAGPQLFPGPDGVPRRGAENPSLYGRPLLRCTIGMPRIRPARRQAAQCSSPHGRIGSIDRACFRTNPETPRAETRADADRRIEWDVTEPMCSGPDRRRAYLETERGLRP